jgi:tight adherence protein B
MMKGIAIRDLWYAIALSGILVGVILLVMGAYYLFIAPLRSRQKIVERLEEASDEHLRRVQILKAELDRHENWLLSFFKRLLGQKYLTRIQSHLLQGDIYWTPSTFLLLVLGLGLAGFIIGNWIIDRFLWALLLMLGLGSLPLLYLRRKKKQKTQAFEQQMPDAMELLSRSLKAGHTLPSAIELLSKEMLHPMGSEMRIAYEEQRFGISMTESLIHMQERVDSEDLRYFVTAVVIQHEAGGNIVEIIEKIAQVIRSRLNFKVKIKALTAEGRLSAVVLTVLPVVLFVLLLFIKNDYEGVLLTDELGHKFLFVAFIMLLAGSYLMRRIVRSVEM